jgi:hypothetical protein
MIDVERANRENIRWLILLTLNSARPVGARESLILATLRAVPAPLTEHELRRELDYLEERGLVHILGRDSPQWSAQLTREGVDVVEYTVPCEPGVARPQKYW